MELVLSIIALCISIAALTWQLVEHLLTGARVKVGTVWSLPVGGLDYLPQCLTITARNVGRFPASVRSVGIALPDDRHAVISPFFVPEMSDDLPLRLEPGDEASWSVPDDRIEALARENGPVSAWRAFVTLGTGKRKHGKLGSIKIR